MILPPSSNSQSSQIAFDLKDLNSRHVRDFDKFFRMYAGAASRLSGFQDGIIQLDIHIDSERETSVEHITEGIARSWLHEAELVHATGYQAHVYKANRPSGFAVDPNCRPSGDLANAIVRWARDSLKGDPDILVAIIEKKFKS